MLNRIQTEDHNIVLRNGSPNLFDIDSISLLIGKNGSGKTITLKSIINAFNPRRKKLLKGKVELFFEGLYRPTTDQLATWGVIYYTPAQNRPKLHNNKNFIDASKRQIRNILSIEKYKDILSAFNLKLNLTAVISADYKKIGLFLADALISNKSFASAEANNLFNLEQSRSLKRQLSRLNDFEASQEEFDNINRSYSESISKLGESILQHITAECRSDKYQLLCCFATVTYMVAQKNLPSSTIIEFIREFLNSSLFNEINVRSDSLEPFKLQALGCLVLLNTFTFESSSNNKNMYFREFTSTEERSVFEKSPGLPMFNIGFPEVSSGQWAIMRQTIAIFEALEDLSDRDGINNILLLIDEGDAFLHLDWQRQYIFQLNAFLMKCKKDLLIDNLQLIIATHSPILATDIPREFVCAVDRDNFASLQPSFAAPLQSILNRSFGSRTIGEFATREINRTLSKLKRTKLSKKDYFIISMIDDPIIKREFEYILDGAQPHVD